MSDIERGTQDDPLWYKDAVIYQLHVKAFLDSNGDGNGDFSGLAQRLDYVQELGVNAIWLLPFYPSPGRDDGYDIADYRDVHPSFGTLADFRQFVREAHRRGIRVITELVVNHTSDQHPWFQAARHAPEGSAKREFYVWSRTKLKFPETRIIFTDTEASNWAWDDVAQAYYWHRFFSHQPDLNHNNPQVVKAVIRVMRFWLDLGVDGLRLDAIPYLCVREGTDNENLPETHAVVRQMRAAIDAHYHGRLFLAEANQWPEDVRDYFGDGDECHMAYHFPLMPRMYMAVAQEDRYPIVEIMRQTPDIPDNCQWAVFLRNHDELTLEMVTDRERDYMYQTYATDPRMRVNVGIRRRLAPLLDNDPDRLKLMNSLLMSMPGSPIVYYGDEIGMGDNIFLGDRNGVRTPMQWSPDRNAGFSRADPQRLYLPPIMDPIYGYQAVNVEAQARHPASLLNWMRRLITVRKSTRAFGRGTLEFLHPGNRKILAYLRGHGDDTILCVANLARSAQPVELDLARFKGRIPVEMMSSSVFPPIGDLPYLLTLSGYGFYWFRLSLEAAVPAWHQEQLPPLELPVLVLFADALSLLPQRVDAGRRQAAERLTRQLAQELLPRYLPTQRWFAAKDQAIGGCTLARQGLLASDDGEWLLNEVEVHSAAGSQRYFLPLALMWREPEEESWSLLHQSVAKVRRRARVGLLTDAFADEGFARALVVALARGQTLVFGDGELRFSTTEAFRPEDVAGVEALAVRRPTVEGSNSAAVLGNRLFVKAYRRLHGGLNPELEMGRFLTGRFANIIPVLGAAEFVAADGVRSTVLLLQRFVENQGDAWNHTLEYLVRFLEECRVDPPTVAQEGALHTAQLSLLRTLGVRTGEMHRALCAATGDDPAFAPEPFTAQELDVWREGLRQDVLATCALLERRADLPAAAAELRERVLAGRDRLTERVARFAVAPGGLLRSRLHGDYHLGQVLVVQNDVVIIDFEGEPERPLAQRRAKHSPLRDVAGMLRSFGYAAHAALLRLSTERPEDYARLEPYALDWERRAAEVFMEGYRLALGECAAWPEDPAAAARLIEMFVLEKVLYELRYELGCRPEWVVIPLRGLLGTMAAAG